MDGGALWAAVSGVAQGCMYVSELYETSFPGMCSGMGLLNHIINSIFGV